MQHSGLINVMLAAMKKVSVSMLRDFHELRFLQTSHKANSIQKFVECTVFRAEEILLKSLQAARPEFGILSHTKGVIAKPDEALIKEYGLTEAHWVVNVLDGIENFMRAIPYFAISIAVNQINSSGEDEILSGAIYAPALGEFYCGEKGSGAWCEFASEGRTGLAETRLRVVDRASAFSVLLTDELNLASSEYKNLQVRMLGASSIALGYLSSGRADKCILNWKDTTSISAGLVIAREAGAIIKTEDHEGKKMLIATTSSVSGG